MIDDDSVRDDIAFIRRAIEQGRGYAGSHSLDLLLGHRPRRGLYRHLRDRQRMVADRFNLAVGGLHRSAMALLAAPAACALVPFRATGNPAALVIKPQAPLGNGTYRLTLHGPLANMNAQALGSDVSLTFTVDALQ